MFSIFQQKEKKSQQQATPELPDNFAQDLMLLELEAENQNVSVDTITKLLELYRIGVEYFENKKSDKYLVFKNKSQSLLLKQNIVNALNRQIEPNEKVVNEKSIKSEENNKQKEIQNNLRFVQQQDNIEKVQLMVQCHNQEMALLKQLITCDISQQSLTLQQRLERRKKNGNQLGQSEQVQSGYFKQVLLTDQDHDEEIPEKKQTFDDLILINKKKTEQIQKQQLQIQSQPELTEQPSQNQKSLFKTSNPQLEIGKEEIVKSKKKEVLKGEKEKQQKKDLLKKSEFLAF